MTPNGVSEALAEAIEWLHTEKRLLGEEQRSFDAFETRVERISPAPAPAPAPATAASIRTLPTVTPTEPTQLARIRDAYRETVMAVSHYESEYGDSLGESLAAEFTPGLAAALTDGAGLTEPIYRQLRREIAHSRQNRADSRTLVESEVEALTEIRGALERISAELDDLDVCPIGQWTTDALLVGWKRLQALRRQCDELATDRQAAIRAYAHEYNEFTAWDSFETYLYPTLSSNRPGLAAIATLGDRLRETEDAFYEELESRNGALETLDDSIPGSPSDPLSTQKTRS